MYLTFITEIPIKYETKVFNSVNKIRVASNINALSIIG